MPPEPDSLVVATDTGDRIHYLDWGEPAGTPTPAIPGPPVLLIHGLLSTAWSWAPVARPLSAMTRVLAMDLRGHGLSDSPRSGYELESQAFDALTVLAANGYGQEVGGRPAVVVGHGLGATVAAVMAGVQPASVAGVGLVDGGWEDIGDATGQTPAEFQAAIGDPPEVMASMSSYLADRRDFDPQTWDSDQERAARAAVDEKHAGHVAPVVRQHALRLTVEAMFGYRPLEVLPALPMPLLVVVAESGAADDETARERRIALDDVQRERAAAGNPAATIRAFAGAGHNVMRYRAAELTAALVELIADAERYQRS